MHCGRTPSAALCMLRQVGALEYDPELIEQQHHRSFLRDKVVFKEVVPIQDTALRAKIHQTYRLGLPQGRRPAPCPGRRHLRHLLLAHPLQQCGGKRLLLGQQCCALVALQRCRGPDSHAQTAGRNSTAACMGVA